jgi:hypothetical protein
MRVRNVHERVLPLPAARVGALLDTLASSHDRLWPTDRWPRMRFDRPLQAGAIGGHGPIRYTVEMYEPGRAVLFRFTAPWGFHGTHGYEVEAAGIGGTRLRHTLEMSTSGPALLSWPLVFRPLHDALIEDSLDRAAVELGVPPASPARWSAWVRGLRGLLARSPGLRTSSSAARRRIEAGPG